MFVSCHSLKKIKGAESDVEYFCFLCMALNMATAELAARC